MKPLIMKFGGSTVEGSKSFLKIAKRIAIQKGQTERIVVVVSAMKNMTDQLIQLAKNVHPNPPEREQDMLISVGERISSSLLAMALKKNNIEAISFTGSQSGIITCPQHSEAKIIGVRPYRIESELSKGKIVIVAGFQGVSLDREITTLGRGGADTSAVALGAALGSERVEFYKDVGAIFTSDPHKDPHAVRLGTLSYSQAIEIAQGGGILHPRCISLAEKNKIALHVLSVDEKRGTQIGNGTRSEAPMYELSEEELG